MRGRRESSEKEIEGIRLAELKSEEEHDKKRLEEMDRTKMRIEREQLEIRRKLRDRDLRIQIQEELFKEKEKQEARHEEELQNCVRAERTGGRCLNSRAALGAIYECNKGSYSFIVLSLILLLRLENENKSDL